MKNTGAKIAKRVASVLLAASLMLSMTGCAKTAAKSLPHSSLVQLEEMNFDTESHSYIYDTTTEEKTETSKKYQQSAEGVYIKIDGDYFPEEELNKAIKTGQEIGIIVTPSNYTYESIYKTIDMVKGCGYPLWMTSSESYNRETDFDKFKQDSFSVIYKTNSEKAMWQYSQNGHIDGISGPVDINYATSTLKNKIIQSEGYKLQ